MFKRWTLKTILILMGTGCLSQEQSLKATAFISPKVIYGDDSRKDWYEVSNPNLLSIADSTLGIINKFNLTINGSTAKLKTHTIGLCPSERFSNQKSGPWCSGFLVAPDIIITSGHCINSQSHCLDLSFIFGFAKKSFDHNPYQIKTTDIYGCKNLLGKKKSPDKNDWAVVQLDRPVTDHKPLKVRRSGSISPNAPLILIGHPSGLPSKISTGWVYSVKNDYFKASLEAYNGSSGSAVFNTQTNKVEGILTQGKIDYEFKNGCKVSNVCENHFGGKCSINSNHPDSEYVTKISEILHLIP